MSAVSYFRPRALSEGAIDAQVLLYRYPDVSESELDSLLATFKNLPLLDFGLLAADERLGAKLNEFYADHGDKLRPALFGELTWLIAPIILVLMALIYAVGG